MDSIIRKRRSCRVFESREEERVSGMAELFGLPENQITFAVIALGYPGQELPEADRFGASKIHYESFFA